MLLAFERQPKLSLRISGTVEVDRHQGRRCLVAGVARSRRRPNRDRRSAAARVHRAPGAHRRRGAARSRAAQSRRPGQPASGCGERRGSRCRWRGALADDARRARRRSRRARQRPRVRQEARRQAPLRSGKQPSVRSRSTPANSTGATPARRRSRRSRSPISRWRPKPIGWPLEAPVVFKGEGVLGTDKERGKLTFSGQGNAAGARPSGIASTRCRWSRRAPTCARLLELPLAGALERRPRRRMEAVGGGRRS